MSFIMLHDSHGRVQWCMDMLIAARDWHSLPAAFGCMHVCLRMGNSDMSCLLDWGIYQKITEAGRDFRDVLQRTRSAFLAAQRPPCPLHPVRLTHTRMVHACRRLA